MGDQVNAMRLLCAIFVYFLLAGCTSQPGQPIGALVVRDTFQFYGDDMITELPDRMVLDTIRNDYEGGLHEVMIVLPRSTAPADLKLEKKLKLAILAKTFVGDTTDMEGWETGVESTTDIVPLTVYRKRHLISYGFLDILSESGRMRPFRKYFSVNYDTGLKRPIFFEDYFSLKTTADSNFLKWMVFGDIGNPDYRYFSLDKEVNFSVDSANIYFYFDMFGFMGNPMGIVKSVKKKYLLPYINGRYK